MQMCVLQMTKMSAKQLQIKLSALDASETPPVDILHKKLLHSLTWFWYFTTRMTNITYVIILRLVLACIQLCTFSNILTSMKVNSWRPFEIVFSPITQSPYSRYILFHCPLFKTCSESAIVVVIASCKPPGYAWLPRAAEFVKILPRNEETSRGGLIVWKQRLG